MLISDQYRAQQETLHEDGSYGTAALAYAPMIAQAINKMEVTHVLDYGCGRNMSLSTGLRGKVNHKFKYQAYDPCVPALASAPIPAEFVACIDVLEHIEEESIDEVLDHLHQLTEAVGFFAIDTGPAAKTLTDGRNAHLLQRPVEWWLPRILCRWELQTFQVTHKDDLRIKFYVVVNAMPGSIQDTSGARLS